MRILYLQSLLESVWHQLYWFITHIPQNILSGCVVSDFSYSHYKPSSQFRVFLPLKACTLTPCPAHTFPAFRRLLRLFLHVQPCCTHPVSACVPLVRLQDSSVWTPVLTPFQQLNWYTAGFAMIYSFQLMNTCLGLSGASLIPQLVNNLYFWLLGTNTVVSICVQVLSGNAVISFWHIPRGGIG